MVDSVGKFFFPYAAEFLNERVADHRRVECEPLLPDAGCRLAVILGGDVAQLRVVEPGAGNADVNIPLGFW